MKEELKDINAELTILARTEVILKQKKETLDSQLK